MAVEKAGIHLTGADSGWPVAAATEPPYVKDGDGNDGIGNDDNPHVSSVAGGIVTDEDSQNEIQTLTVTAPTASGTWKPTTASAAVARGASATVVQTALEAVFGVGNVTVGRSGSGPWVYTITFGGALTDTDIDALVPVDVDLAGTNHGVVQADVSQGSP